MPDRTLHGCRVLVVEDEYLLADELRTELSDADAIVIGPVGTVADALDLIRSRSDIEGAVLDVNLRGDEVFPVADLLVEKGVPFLLTTGYDKSVIPSRFADVVQCGKPVNIKEIIDAIGRIIQA